jgi:hypothetical protein
MTKDDFMAKYGDVEVTFSSYYKYTFMYEAVLDNGHTLTVSIGGNADDIYRMDVANNETLSLYSLDPYAGEVTGSDGKIVDEFYDY